VYGRKAVDMGFSFSFSSSVLFVRVPGFMDRCICWWLYPFCLNTLVRRVSSGARDSLSHNAIALCTRDERTECLLAGW
jgi:hypothetical protein